ncbi:MAG: Lrp/AsnC ligand binding domain-containing protein [Dehalococcoidia bacterium]|nr:Lrp/AsnC ligand binding domain-containing protein [Dehalococcoidia bacterium]
MATKAFVLIESSVGKTKDVLSAVQKLPGVKSVDGVTGPYDIIVVLEGKDLTTIGEIVTSKIHPIPGVTRTVTCLAISVG